MQWLSWYLPRNHPTLLVFQPHCSYGRPQDWEGLRNWGHVLPPYTEVRENDIASYNIGNNGKYISFCCFFKYLGSIFHKSLLDTHDVNARIGSAKQAFNALRKILTQKIDPSEKKITSGNNGQSSPMGVQELGTEWGGQGAPVSLPHAVRMHYC